MHPESRYIHNFHHDEKYTLHPGDDVCDERRRHSTEPGKSRLRREPDKYDRLAHLRIVSTADCEIAHQYVGVKPQLTFLFIVSYECRAYEIVICEVKQFI